MYAKNLKLHRGVDNRLQFQFINQEQKPVNITDKEITLRILNHEGTEVLLQKLLELTLPLTGLAELIVDSTELDAIAPQLGLYTLEIPVGSFDLPVFVDSNSGARGKIEILDSVMPSFVPSQTVDVVFPSNNAIYYSNEIIPTSASSTIVVSLTDFTGNVQIQGSTSRSEWYDIGSLESYTNETSLQYYNVDGFHPYIKLKFANSQGTVDSILLR